MEEGPAEKMGQPKLYCTLNINIYQVLFLLLLRRTISSFDIFDFGSDHGLAVVLNPANLWLGLEFNSILSN